ncbi:hypothetical protein TNCV_2089681 [Trichonephila clavipes]|nr:hypothetical protein TNCV_2089681 [Trichonephila clavipes]
MVSIINACSGAVIWENDLLDWRKNECIIYLYHKAVLASTHLFLNHHFGDKQLVTVRGKPHGDFEWYSGYIVLEPATSKSEVNALDD